MYVMLAMFRTIFFFPSAIRLFSFSRRELLSSPRTIRPSNVTTDTPSTSLFVILTVMLFPSSLGKCPPVRAPSTYFELFWSREIIDLRDAESFSFQQPQSHRAFGLCGGRCAGDLNATSKAFRQQPHKYDRGRRVKSLEPCPPFSFGNHTIRHFAKLCVLEQFF